MNSRMMSMIKIITIIAFFSFFTVGFNHDQDIDDFVYAVAIGIDSAENNNLKVHFQFTRPTSSEGGSSSEPAPTFIYSVEASSVASAISLINNYVSKQVNLSHCKVIVFSEEFAEKGLANEIYSLANNVQIRPDVGVIVSKCNSKYFIENSEPVFETLVAKYYEIVPATTEITGYTAYVKIADFLNQLNCKTCEPSAILGGVSVEDSFINEVPSSSNTQKDMSIKAGSSSGNSRTGSESIGLAVFKEDKLVGELTGIETAYYLLLTNKLDTFNVSIPSPFDSSSNLDLSIFKQKNTKNTVTFVNGLPYITIDANIKARIISKNENSQALNIENTSRIESALNQYLEENISNFLYKTSLEFNSDMLGLGRFAISKFSTNNDWNNYNWKDNYRNSIFKINVNSQVVSSLLFTEV